jgi:hypothetical protein
MITNFAFMVPDIQPYDIKNYDLAMELLAQECIHGTFGNGKQRKEMLGRLYYDVQHKVNKIMSDKHG